MDKSPGNEDSASVRSDAGDSPGIMRTFRESIRRVKSPLAPGGKGSKVNDSGSHSPLSPSLSSPLPSPLKNLFHKKEEDECDAAPHRGKGLSRSKTDPNMSSLKKRGALIRRSLKIGKKASKPEAAEGSAEEEKREQVKEEEEQEEEEMEESYTLPEIPHTPLSVMQINKLIEMEVLEEAHLNLLALRREFLQERESCSGEDCPMELAKKEKDLNLLYGDLRNKLSAIVRDSNSFPSRNKSLLVLVARIIQEEERRSEEPGGLPGSWMEAWREAVCEGVRAKVDSVHLEWKEQNASWLAVHLGLLGKAIVEDLESVKRELRWSYPPSFQVFSTYVRSYHRVVGQHLKKLEQHAREMRDLYALLDWILNRYKSERIMGSPTLQPDMKDESIELQLEDDFMQRLKDKYCCRAKDDMKFSLDKVTELEMDEVWREGKSPEKEEDVLNSLLHMDILTKVKGIVVNSRAIDATLEQQVIVSCLQELREFPKRFEAEFRRHCSALRPKTIWTEYHISYINSFSALQQHMDEYGDCCPLGVDALRTETSWIITRLLQVLEDQFREEVKPFLRRMMTRKWLTNDEDFEQLYSRTDQLSQHCALMRSPHDQDFASRLHYHVVKEYVSQLMKNNYSCKNRKHEKAANKIRVQCANLKELFEDMKSTNEWLYSIGDDLSDVIKQKNKSDIKNHLQPLVERYPDFSREHLVAVLYFRGPLRGREHQLILQRLADLKKKKNPTDGDKSRVLFSDMQVTVNTDCFSNLPFCLIRLLPDS